MKPLNRLVSTVLGVRAKDLKHPLLPSMDRTYLVSYGSKVGELCDFIKCTATGHCEGLSIYGRPGTGKTYTVTKVLELLNVDFLLCNSQITPRGLFDSLAKNLRSVIVFDDVHSSIFNPQMLQVFLAAFDGMFGQKRTVTYNTAKHGREKVEFAGSGIAISNRQVRPNDGPAGAAISRLFPFHYDPTDGELLAMTRARCLQGIDGLTARQCFEVLDFVAESGKRFDLRTLKRALNFYRSCRESKNCQTWQEMVSSALNKHVDDQGRTDVPTRQVTKDHELKIVSDLLVRFPDRKQRAERDKQWSSLTGKSPDSLYRRMRELKAKKRAA